MSKCPQVEIMELKEALQDITAKYYSLVNALYKIRKGDETFANQGQGMDGYSQLYNYNGLVDQVIKGGKDVLQSKKT